MKILFNILIPIVTVFITAFGIYNYVPVGWFDKLSPSTRLLSHKLGADITTIAGTDTLKSSRTTINTNFDNLNKYKTETSTTSIAAITTLSNLVSIGTITTGTWQASAVGAGYGGTGSTTLSANQVLLGNGTAQVAVVNGLGASGQFLTSNGAGSAPTWTTSAVSQSNNYAWTGVHTFLSTVSASSSPTRPITVDGEFLITATNTVSGWKATTTAVSIGGINYEYPATTTGAINQVLEAATVSGAPVKFKWANHNCISTSLIPIPIFESFSTSTSGVVVNVGSGSTFTGVGAFFVPCQITVGKISVVVDQVNTSGTFDIAVYSEDGQTKIIDITTATFSTTGVKSTAVSPAVTFTPGIYYVGIDPNTGPAADANFDGWNCRATKIREVASEPTYCFNVDITGTPNAPPATISPIGAASVIGVLMVRLDN